ncbi:16 kDa calcium-binding protein-like [Tubulanus polymorphus]|uniref:16 kDa calcium-binding protein-like n=1 Tax=Tubulanus polymorphus TaxID=672921 RepID=UPI003DA306DF
MESEMYHVFVNICQKYKITAASTKLDEAFKDFKVTDTNNDKTLDREEIKQLGLSKECIDELFTSDIDGSKVDRITLRELFRHIFLPTIEKKWKKLFKQLDTDDSGFISPDELVPYLKMCGMTEADIDLATAVIETYDLNDDNQLSYDEFSKYLNEDLDSVIELLTRDL